MLTAVAYLLAFVAVVVLVQTLASVAFASRDRNQRVNRRLTLIDRGLSPEQVYAALVRQPPKTQMEGIAPDLYDRVFLYCRQAGLSMSPQRLAAYVAGGALVLWLVALIVMSAVHGSSFLLNAMGSLVGAIVLSSLAAFFWVTRLRNRRLAQLETQMPLALDVVVRALRAGHPVISAVQLAAEEMADPIGSEFGLIVDETTYGLEFTEALRNFADRTGSQDAAYFAVSVGIQSQTGGNLAEILQNLSTVIRGRQTLRLRVRALASEGKMSALILTALPLGIVGFISLTQPAFYTSKFSDPIFWPTVGVIAALYAVGQVIIRRIVNFKY
jgi:tight adherence protein B